jgi:hypothetical protein
MIYGMKQIARYWLGTDVAGRSLAVRPDDSFIVSYPRSGNTWTRFLLANLLHPDVPVNFTTIEKLIPDVEAQSSRYMKRIPSPRVIKSHQYFDHRYRRVLYIVRDPRDVVLSYYDFSRKYRHITDGYPLENYVSDFVNARLSSASWGTWGENVGSWLAARQEKPGFLLVRYEDLKAGAAIELSRIAEFFGVRCSSEGISKALQQSSADHMRKMEETQSQDWIATKDKRADVPFVGSAEVGNWKTKLPSPAVAEIEAAWGDLMSGLGYDLSQRGTGKPNVASPTDSTQRDVQVAAAHTR